MNIWAIILLFFAFQALTCSFLLFIKKSKLKQANLLWSVFLFLFSFNIAYSVLYWSNFSWSLRAHLTYVFFIPVSLYGPLFFFYIKKLVTKKKFRLIDLLHLIPLIVVLINYGEFYLLPLSEKAEIFRGRTMNEFVLIPAMLLMWCSSFILLSYSIATYLIYSRFYSNDPEMKLWLKLISTVFVLFGICWFICVVYIQLDLLNEREDYYLSFMMAVFILLTTYFGFNHHQVFNGTTLKKVFPIIKYEKSGLSKKVLYELKEKLVRLVESQELYLDNELTLMDLAEALRISRHHTSQIINVCFNSSFYEFINKYRIEVAEKLLINEDSNLNITDIAYKSGFNNRVSFYNAFKKNLGITPTEYRNQNLVS